MHAPVTRPSWVRRNLAVLVPWVLVAALGSALVVSLGDAPGSDDTAGDSYDLTVEFTLYDYKTFNNGCVGTSGYTDIGPGTQVTVRNGEGTTLGIGSLSTGEGATGSPQANCTWQVAIADVPSGEAFYAVEIASRGEITQSEAELAANGYGFSVSLGN